MRGMPNDGEKNPDADKLSELRDMEAKVRRLRETSKTPYATKAERSQKSEMRSKTNTKNIAKNSA